MLKTRLVSIPVAILALSLAACGGSGSSGGTQHLPGDTSQQVPDTTGSDSSATGSSNDLPSSFLSATNGNLYVNVGGDMYMDTSTGNLIQPIGGNEYIDYTTGEIIFVYEEGTLHTHDLAKLKAGFEQHRVQLSADTIKARFGLSDDRSMEIAKLAVQLADAPRRSLTDADYDSFMKEVTGSTVAEVQSAIAKSTAGSTGDLEHLLDRAAVVNGIGPEHARELFQQILTLP